jgi:hypothetical protein
MVNGEWRMGLSSSATILAYVVVSFFDLDDHLVQHAGDRSKPHSDGSWVQLEFPVDPSGEFKLCFELV